MKKRIHVNQHVIRSNKKNNENNPVITVKTYQDNVYGNEVQILGESTVVYRPNINLYPVVQKYGLKQMQR
jgi:hypothetical protein